MLSKKRQKEHIEKLEERIAAYEIGLADEESKKEAEELASDQNVGDGA